MFDNCSYTCSPWTSAGKVFPSGCSVIQHAGNCTPSTPDANFVNNQYIIYYAVSEPGTTNSAIGVVVSGSMVSGTWMDLGKVLESSEGQSVFNASEFLALHIAAACYGRVL